MRSTRADKRLAFLALIYRALTAERQAKLAERWVDHDGMSDHELTRIRQLAAAA
jgi:hypothetical protein